MIPFIYMYTNLCFSLVAFASCLKIRKTSFPFLFFQLLEPQQQPQTTTPHTFSNLSTIPHSINIQQQMVQPTPTTTTTTTQPSTQSNTQTITNQQQLGDTRLPNTTLSFQ